MFGEFADAQDLAGCAELLLDGVVGVDGGLGLVGAVEVPGVEAGEVLDCAEELVAADWMWVDGLVGGFFWYWGKKRCGRENRGGLELRVGVTPSRFFVYGEV